MTYFISVMNDVVLWFKRIGRGQTVIHQRLRRDRANDTVDLLYLSKSMCKL